MRGLSGNLKYEASPLMAMIRRLAKHRDLERRAWSRSLKNRLGIPGTGIKEGHTDRSAIHLGF